MRLTVNGRPRTVEAEDHETLLEVLRVRLELTGTKQGCDRGECGACTVLRDGRPVYACLTLAASCEGSVVTTVEGLGSPLAPHPVQRAFAEHDAAQCGFCTPGQVMAAAALLERTAHPDRDTIVAAMSGNLCRCGTYPRIVQAIESLAARPVLADPSDAS